MSTAIGTIVSKPVSNTSRSYFLGCHRCTDDRMNHHWIPVLNAMNECVDPCFWNVPEPIEDEWVSSVICNEMPIWKFATKSIGNGLNNRRAEEERNKRRCQNMAAAHKTTIVVNCSNKDTLKLKCCPYAWSFTCYGVSLDMCYRRYLFTFGRQRL